MPNRKWSKARREKFEAKKKIKGLITPSENSLYGTISSKDNTISIVAKESSLRVVRRTTEILYSDGRIEKEESTYPIK